jgi:hypothetical protein
MIIFFIIQYIYFNQNIILTATPTSMQPAATTTTAQTATPATTTTTPQTAPATIPPKTVWYLAFQSD